MADVQYTVDIKVNSEDMSENIKEVAKTITDSFKQGVEDGWSIAEKETKQRATKIGDILGSELMSAFAGLGAKSKAEILKMVNTMQSELKKAGADPFAGWKDHIHFDKVQLTPGAKQLESALSGVGNSLDSLKEKWKILIDNYNNIDATVAKTSQARLEYIEKQKQKVHEMAKILSSVLTPALGITEAQIEKIYSIDKKTGSISRASLFGVDIEEFKSESGFIENNLKEMKERLGKFDASKILGDLPADLQKEVDRTAKLITASIQNFSNASYISSINEDFNNFIYKLQNTFKVAKDDIPNYIHTLRSKITESIKDITPESILNTHIKGALYAFGIGPDLQKKLISEWSDAQKALLLSADSTVEKFKEIAEKIGEDFSFGFKKAEEAHVEIPVKIEEPEKVTEEVKEVVEAIEQKAEETPIEVPVQPVVNKESDIMDLGGAMHADAQAEELDRLQELTLKYIEAREIFRNTVSSAMSGDTIDNEEFVRQTAKALTDARDALIQYRKQSGEWSDTISPADTTSSDLAESERERVRKAFESVEQTINTEGDKIHDAYKNALSMDGTETSPAISSNIREEIKAASSSADEYAKKQKASSAKAKKSIEEVIDSAKKLVQALNKVGKAAVDLGKSAVKLGFGTLKGMLHTFTLGLGSAKKEATLLSQALKLVGIAGIGALFKKANESATELTKNMNIVNEQFGESAAGLHKWAEQSAWAFNVSRTEAEKYFGELGDFLSNVGVEAEQSAVMVKNMVGYSGLIATRKGLKTEDVEKVFAKVIEGSTRGQAYKATLGIDLNDKAINSALKSMNIEATYSDLNEADKATARWLATMYQLSDQFDLTADALGNFEGKISTWDGAIETITSNAKDALTDLGLILQHYLLPIVQVLARIVSALANSLRNLVGALGLDIPEAPALEDTADGIGKLGDEYEKTGKKAKKAGLGLASFDKLNNLSSGSSADGIGGASSKLKDAVGLFDKIPDVSKQRKTLQEMLDSLMNKDWNLAGQNFGKWVNSIVKSAKSLVDRLKKYNLGKKLASWVNGVFKGIDWKNAGELFGGLWDLIFDNIESFLRELNTKDIGTAIQQFLKWFDIQDKLGDIGTNFGLVIQKISEIINNIFEGEDGQKLLSDIENGFSDMINNALKEINPSDLADAASYLIKAVLGAIKGIFNNANAKKLGKFTSTFTKEMASNGVYKDIGETFAGVITSAITYAGSVLGDGHTVVDLVNGLFEGIKNAFSDPSFDFSESMKGIAKGIGEGLSSLGKQISDSSSGINVELNDFFSSKEFQTFANGLADFLVSAITFACDTVVTQLPTILKTLFDAVVKEIAEDPWGVTKTIAGLFAWSKFVSVGGLKGIVTFAGRFAKTLASKILHHPQIAALLLLIGSLWQSKLDEMYNEAKEKSIKQVQAFWEGVADGTEKGSAQIDVLKNNKKSELEEFNTYMAKTSSEIQELESQIYNPQGSSAEERVKNRNAAIESIKEKYRTLIDRMKEVGLATDDVEIALEEFEEQAKTKLYVGLSETDKQVSDTIIALNNLTLEGGRLQLDWDATFAEMSQQPGIVGQAVDELGTKTGEVLPSVEEKMNGILTSANDSALSMGLLSGQADSAAEKFEGLIQTNNRVMKALEQQKKRTEQSEQALAKQKEETERLKTENGYLSNAIELLSKTDLPTFKKSVEELNTPLDHFLELLSKIHTSDFGMGKITDTVALQKNMDDAYHIVEKASKDIDGAIAAASNLRNFEATLSSTQTIKVDSSGTMNFKFDVTTKPDKDAFNSWQEKYTKANKALNG